MTWIAFVDRSEINMRHKFVTFSLNNRDSGVDPLQESA